MTTREILEDARKRIEDPKHWTQHAVARDALRQVVSSSAGNAACWCALGSLNRSSFDLLGATDKLSTLDLANEAHDLLDYVAVDLYGTGIANVNDNHGHDAVMACYEVAISRA